MQQQNVIRSVFVGITGASGSIYALDLLRQLQGAPGVERIHLAVSAAGMEVVRHELGVDPAGPAWPGPGLTKIVLEREDNLSAAPASGSYPLDAVVVVPCSMSSLGHIAGGTGRNLIHRAADVALKERRTLILVPRETPLHTIHLENMLRAARAGALILPAMPAFYSRPATMDELVETVTLRIMAHLGSPIPAGRCWSGGAAAAGNI